MFPSTTNASRFCSMACFSRKLTKHCETCDVEFKVSPSRNARRFCSGACYWKSHQSGRPRTSFMRSCEICGTEFKIWPCRATTARFCSRTCQGQAMRGKPSARAAGLTKPCAQCGVQFKVQLSKLNIRFYCGRRCASQALRSLTPRLAYVTISANGRQVYEHRHIMERVLGRPLTRKEHVHHINGNPTDNRIENLELLSASEHQRKTGLHLQESRRQRRLLLP